jgi:hypothetical protein
VVLLAVCVGMRTCVCDIVYVVQARASQCHRMSGIETDARKENGSKGWIKRTGTRHHQRNESENHIQSGDLLAKALQFAENSEEEVSIHIGRLCIRASRIRTELEHFLGILHTRTASTLLGCSVETQLREGTNIHHKVQVR